MEVLKLFERGTELDNSTVWFIQLWLQNAIWNHYKWKTLSILELNFTVYNYKYLFNSATNLKTVEEDSSLAGFECGESNDS